MDYGIETNAQQNCRTKEVLHKDYTRKTEATAAVAISFARLRLRLDEVAS
jgi:hypothetical protein